MLICIVCAPLRILCLYFVCVVFAVSLLQQEYLLFVARAIFSMLIDDSIFVILIPFAATFLYALRILCRIFFSGFLRAFPAIRALLSPSVEIEFGQFFYCFALSATLFHKNSK